MLPGFHKKQNSTAHKPDETGGQMSGAPEASTINTASYSDKKSRVNNNNTIETIAENEFLLNIKNVVNHKK